MRFSEVLSVRVAWAAATIQTSLHDRHHLENNLQPMTLSADRRLAPSVPRRPGDGSVRGGVAESGRALLASCLIHTRLILYRLNQSEIGRTGRTPAPSNFGFAALPTAAANRECVEASASVANRARREMIARTCYYLGLRAAGSAGSLTTVGGVSYETRTPAIFCSCCVGGVGTPSRRWKNDLGEDPDARSALCDVGCKAGGTSSDARTAPHRSKLLQGQVMHGAYACWLRRQ